jgi:hypothetical protein
VTDVSPFIPPNLPGSTSAVEPGIGGSPHSGRGHQGRRRAARLVRDVSSRSCRRSRPTWTRSCGSCSAIPDDCVRAVAGPRRGQAAPPPRRPPPLISPHARRRRAARRHYRRSARPHRC